MRQSFITFLCFVLAAVLIVGAEGAFLLLKFEYILSKLAKNTNDASALAGREIAIERLERMRGTLEAQTSGLLAGYAPEPLNISQETFGDLFLLGVQISPLDEPSNKAATSWNYKLSSSSIEYHRLIPAISALENQYPLGSFIQIDLKSTGPPFAMTPEPVNFTGRFAILRGRP